MSALDFIEVERAFMLSELKYIVANLQRDLKLNPTYYTESGCDEPSIDVRLCIDDNDRYMPQ